MSDACVMLDGYIRDDVHCITLLYDA